MGLRLFLQKEANFMHTDIDAYWSVDDSPHYDIENVYFTLCAYPSREAKLATFTPIPVTAGIVNAKGDKFGASHLPIYDARLYRWEGAGRISDIFPNGIPVSVDAQKTAIYEFIKEYTELPWIDVIE